MGPTSQNCFFFYGVLWQWPIEHVGCQLQKSLWVLLENGVKSENTRHLLKDEVHKGGLSELLLDRPTWAYPKNANRWSALSSKINWCCNHFSRIVLGRRAHNPPFRTIKWWFAAGISFYFRSNSLWFDSFLEHCNFGYFIQCVWVPLRSELAFMMTPIPVCPSTISAIIDVCEH